jgi:prepilin-type N-terminal cleavage/methylation domain-containing protein
MTTLPRRRAHERGMTLVELMIALVVFAVILGAALAFLGRQSRAYRTGTERMEILQNLRFAAGTLARDLRTAGANVPEQQPVFVYASATVLAFNGDYATNVAGDAWAVYHDPDAPTGAVTALRPADQITPPGSSFQWPTVQYTMMGANSPAELQMFYFQADASTTRTDDFVLFRQVNDQAPEMVARNLLQTPGQPFFQYFRLRRSLTAPPAIQAVPSGDLPLRHATPFHLSPADTGATSRIDSLRGVLISFTATNGLDGTRERRRALSRLVRFPNAGMATLRTCGDEPILGVALAAAVVTDGTGVSVVRLVWNAAVDEGGGENDVVRYVVWRRDSGTTDWGDPYLSIPAGNTAYLLDDGAVTSGASYDYALAAQDCTPMQSQLSIAGPVIVP